MAQTVNNTYQKKVKKNGRAKKRIEKRNRTKERK